MHINNSIRTIRLISVYFFISVFCPAFFAQDLSGSELDSIYNKFLQLSSPELIAISDRLNELTPEDRKCGFGLVSQIKYNLDKFTIEQQKILSRLLQRPVKQASIVSPSGIFRIHFNYTGTEVPIYDNTLNTDENVMMVALALDSSYNFEVNHLGYPAPPFDNGQGGDDLYDVYITLARNNYGLTDPEDPLGDEKYTSFIEIHYNFASSNFYTHGLAAMRVTVAHELHHAIQVGNYIYRSSDGFFYELTSTSMEEFVFDDVNDYYGYIPEYFDNPHRSFSNNSGYNLPHWNIFLQDNFGFEIIKNQWELMPTMRAILAIGNSLLERNSTFARELNRFGIWTYYTGHRTVAGYFEEAASYPLISPHSIIPFPQFNSAQVDAQITSNNFIVFNITSNNDSLYAIVTNGDINAAVLLQNPTNIFEYILYANANSGQRNLTDNYSSDFLVSDPNWWSVSEILNGLIVREDSAIVPITDIAESFIFPNPYRYSGDLSISIEAKLGENLDFNVYSSGLTLIHSSQEIATPLINNTIGVSWNGFDNEGNKLASGVYIYVIKNGDEVVKGKVVIFNE